MGAHPLSLRFKVGTEVRVSVPREHRVKLPGTKKYAVHGRTGKVTGTEFGFVRVKIDISASDAQAFKKYMGGDLSRAIRFSPDVITKIPKKINPGAVIKHNLKGIPPAELLTSKPGYAVGSASDAIKEFIKSSNKGFIDTKGKQSYASAIAKFKKDHKVVNFYMSYQKPSTTYRDDHLIIYYTQKAKSNPIKGGRSMATRKQIAAARRNIKKAQKKRRTPKQIAASKRNIKKAQAASKKRAPKKAAKSTSKSKALNAHKGERKGQHVKRKGRWYIVVAGRKLRKSTASAANKSKAKKRKTMRVSAHKRSAKRR